jgi:YHS domain-containing protein
MKKISFSLGVALLAVMALAAIADEAVKLDAIKCVFNPKGAAKADHAVDYKGGKVYFCCENCPKKFDPAKNAVAANHQLVATKQAKQVKCPISGQATNSEHKISIGGVNVEFCCENCQGEVSNAKDEAQWKLVFSNEVFDKAFEVVAKKK